jgi:hypothetical protein
VRGIAVRLRLVSLRKKSVTALSQLKIEERSITMKVRTKVKAGGGGDPGNR